MLNFRLDAYVSSVGSVAQRLVDTKVAASGIALTEYAEHFTAVARERQRSMFFFLIPALAVLFVPFARRRYYVVFFVYLPLMFVVVYYST